MPAYLIRPQAPLVFRTGRPFGTSSGGETLPFPLPSTIAGALRTAWAEQQPQRPDYAKLRETLQDNTGAGAFAVAGPLAAAIAADGCIEVLLPRPADALYLGNGEDLQVWRLQPRDLPPDSGCDLPDGLLPVLLDPAAPKANHQKGHRRSGVHPCWPNGWQGAHRIGRRPHMALRRCRSNPAPTSPCALTPGPARPANCSRAPASTSAPGTKKPAAGRTESYALLARSNLDIDPTLRRLGGEGRLAHIAPVSVWPRPPAGLFEAIIENHCLRLVLATPALFAGGWRPGWLDDCLEGSPPDCPGLRLKLRAAAIERWQAVSGWDMAAGKAGKGGQPRAVRRLAPAGAVYWFDIIEGDATALAALWLTPLADDPQDRCDGYGLALPGCW